MELRQLEAFAATMSSGSVSGAARLLGRSQPAVSRLIQELETEIGYALFVRSGPRVSPTEQGFLLFEDVSRALSSLRQIRERAEDIARGRSRPLRLVATSALAVGLLPAALARIQTTLDATPLEIRSAAPEEVVHAVQSGAAHCGLSSLPLEHKGLNVHWIGQAPCAVALREDDALAARPVLTLSELADRRLITMANRYRLRHQLDRAWSGLNGPLRSPHIETNSSLNAQAFVRAGLGVAVLEPVTLTGTLLPGLVARPLSEEIPFFFGVVTPQSMPVNAALRALSDALLAVATETLPGFVCHDADRHGELLKQLYADHVP